MSQYETFKAEFNSKEVVKELEKISKETSNLKPFLRVARTVLLGFIDDNFDTEGEASGDKWQELDPEYAEKKKEADAVDKILQFGGDLRKRIYQKVTDRELILGSALGYSAVHNFGFEERNIPQREYFRFSDPQLDELVAEIEYHYLKKIKYMGVE